MWRAIDRMSYEPLELVHGDAGDDGGEDGEIVPACINLFDNGPVLEEETLIAP